MKDVYLRTSTHTYTHTHIQFHLNSSLIWWDLNPRPFGNTKFWLSLYQLSYCCSGRTGGIYKYLLGFCPWVFQQLLQSGFDLRVLQKLLQSVICGVLSFEIARIVAMREFGLWVLHQLLQFGIWPLTENCSVVTDRWTDGRKTM